MELTITHFALDIPPDYVRRLTSEGVELDSMLLRTSLAWYDGSGWAQEEFVSGVIPNDSYDPPDFDLFEVCTAHIADGAVRVDISVALDGHRAGSPFHIGDGSATFDRPFHAPRSLVEIACVDLTPEDSTDSDAPEIEDLDMRLDFAYLTWRVAAPLDLQATLEGLSAPFPAGVYLDPSPDTSRKPDMWEYRPQSDSTIVVDRNEWAPFAAAALNWQSWDVAQDAGSAPYRGVFHKPRPSRANQRLRSLQEVTTIVLHETAGWQMDRTNVVPTTWTTGSLGTQFKIQTDGRVVQMYDALQRTSHVGTPGFNDPSVGIEIVNIVFPPPVRGMRRPQIAGRYDRWDGRESVFRFELDSALSFLADRSPRALVPMRPTTWAILPTPAQLEAAYQLTVQLAALGIRPENPIADPGLLFPADISDPDRDRFLLDTWIAELSQKPGVICHGSVQANRSDGYAASLYCWLRSSSTVAGSGAEQAFEALLDLFDIGLVRHRCSDGARRWCADTAGFAPPRHVRKLA